MKKFTYITETCFIKLADSQYYKARFYDPSIGRFLNPDTIIPDEWNLQAYNRYSYVVGNPITYVDPTGHEYTFANKATEDFYLPLIDRTRSIFPQGHELIRTLEDSSMYIQLPGQPHMTMRLKP